MKRRTATPAAAAEAEAEAVAAVATSLRLASRKAAWWPRTTRCEDRRERSGRWRLGQREARLRPKQRRQRQRRQRQRRRRRCGRERACAAGPPQRGIQKDGDVEKGRWRLSLGWTKPYRHDLRAHD
ncbi:unnamed protein product [Ectocarpus sp. 12 AP-2014]